MFSRPLPLLYLTALLLGSCQATETDRPSSNLETAVRASMIRGFAKGCHQGMDQTEPEKLEVMKRLLRHSNMSIAEYCNCIGENIMNGLSPDELGDLIREGERNASDMVKREPWRSRFEKTALQCMTRRLPNA